MCVCVCVCVCVSFDFHGESDVVSRLPWQVVMCVCTIFFTPVRSLRYSFLHHNCQKSSVSSEAVVTKPLLLSVSLRMSIVSIVAREILDSRGNPTVEVDLRTEKGERRRGMKNNMLLPPRDDVCSDSSCQESVKKARRSNSISESSLTSDDLHSTSVQINQLSAEAETRFVDWRWAVKRMLSLSQIKWH